MTDALSSAPARIVWVTHPRHLPRPPQGRVVVVDVAFAAGAQFRSKTLPFITALGEQLVRWIDHHEHREGWARFGRDPRFVLVPNRQAHACPELITPELVRAAEDEGAIEAIVAHADFDGLIAAVKWRLGGISPWPAADEDARAVDSPGRGHALSERGERIALALEEASGVLSREERVQWLGRLAEALCSGVEPPGLSRELDEWALAAREARAEALVMAERCGREEVPGVFVVRTPVPLENRVRKYLLMAAEVRAPVGALYEPDPQGGAWVTAATFDEAIDLEQVPGFEGGRSDYRFARAVGDGASNLAALSRYLGQRAHS